MKMRWMMVGVAIAAVMIWLAIPAIRIWRDPTLRAHSHEVSSPIGKMTRVRVEPPLAAKTMTMTSQGVKLQHQGPLFPRYRAMLLRRPWSTDPAACGQDGYFIVEAVIDDPRPPNKGEAIIRGVSSFLSRYRAKAAN